MQRRDRGAYSGVRKPVIAAKLAAARIPVITFDIAQKGWYFVGINNSTAGLQGGEALGWIIKAKWDCSLDEVIASGLPVVGIIDTERTGGMIKGIQKICPNIPKSKTIEFDGDGEVSASATAARALLAAHPSWSKIAVVGINDDGVVGALEAAEQLGRAKDIIGWGQSGDLDTGANVDPHLLGSVFYFLEGYAEYAVPLLKQIAAGHAAGDGRLHPQQRRRTDLPLLGQHGAGKAYSRLQCEVGQAGQGERGYDPRRRLLSQDQLRVRYWQ